jgi:hypothetical protein
VTTVFTVVLEFNHGKHGSSLGSVWLFAGDGRPDLERVEALDGLPGWLRLIGPVEHELASRVQEKLVVFLRSSGVEVIDEAIAE